MVLEDILSLVKAGYTRHEIEQMAGTAVSNPEPAPVAETTQETIPAQAQVVEPVAVPEAAPAPVTQPIQAPVQDQPTMAQVMESIAKLTSAVQANAIAQSVIPQGISQPVHAEDMLAEIIRPTFKARE